MSENDEAKSGSWHVFQFQQNHDQARTSVSPVTKQQCQHRTGRATVQFETHAQRGTGTLQPKPSPLEPWGGISSGFSCDFLVGGPDLLFDGIVTLLMIFAYQSMQQGSCFSGCCEWWRRVNMGMYCFVYTFPFFMFDHLFSLQNLFCCTRIRVTRTVDI